MSRREIVEQWLESHASVYPDGIAVEALVEFKALWAREKLLDDVVEAALYEQNELGSSPTMTAALVALDTHDSEQG